MSQINQRTFLVLAMSITFVIVAGVNSQVNFELDQPFRLRSGVDYRDTLTVAASQAVVEYAKRYQRRQDAQVGIYMAQINVIN